LEFPLDVSFASVIVVQRRREMTRNRFQ